MATPPPVQMLAKGVGPWNPSKRARSMPRRSSTPRESPERSSSIGDWLSNCTFDRGSLSPTYNKPFDLLVGGNERGDWLGGRDSNPDNVVQSHVSYRWTTSQHQSRLSAGARTTHCSQSKTGPASRARYWDVVISRRVGCQRTRSLSSPIMSSLPLATI